MVTDMEIRLPALQLDSTARPSADGFKHGIRDHPAFCYVCTNFDFEVADALFVPAMSEGLHIDNRIRSVMRTSTMQEVIEAADGGCYSCKILKILIEMLCENAFDPESDEEVTITYCEHTTMTVQVGDCTSIELFTLQDAPCPWPTIGNEIVAVDPYMKTWQVPGGKASILQRDPRSEECFLQIKEWTANCEKDHPYCRSQTNTIERPALLKVFPKRVIDVGSDEHDVRLVKHPGVPTDYAALSYCWGNSSGLNLSKGNEEQLCKSIPFEELLQTHQDAIVITRKLGLQYLWTDALCIRQDDNEEKATEIGNMSFIYTGAYLTIAVTSARHADEGCLNQRYETYRLPVINEKGNASTILARRQLPHVAFDWNVSDPFSPAARNLFTPDASIMAQYPLFTRGWCFQERLLSTRIIHFTAHEIIWECLGMTCCECGTMDDFVGSRALRERRYAAGIPQDIEVRCGKLERSRNLAKRLGLLDYGAELGSLSAAIRNDHALMCAILGHEFKPDDADNEGAKRWRDLITQYSRRNLGFATDVLLAVSGLASAWVASLETAPKYLAGLWQDDLFRGVLWKCIDEEPKVRPAEYLAPTWSWASIRRAIDWLPANEIESQPVYHTTIREAKCETSHANPYGQVVSGHMIVDCQVVKAIVASTDNSGATAFAKAENKISAFKPDCIPEVKDMVGQEVFCLWWSTDVNDPRTGLGWERALVLQTCDAKEFIRVGIMEHFPVEEWRDLLEQRTLHLV